MILTEEEAKTKWCPMARYGELHGPEQGAAAAFNYNRTDVPNAPPIPNTCRCIASECMAWKWETAGEDMGRQHNNPGAERHGYCGLTSK